MTSPLIRAAEVLETEARYYRQYGGSFKEQADEYSALAAQLREIAGKQSLGEREG